MSDVPFEHPALGVISDADVIATDPVYPDMYDEPPPAPEPDPAASYLPDPP